VNSCGVLSGAIIAQVVYIDAINNVLNATLFADFFQSIEQLIFAVEAS